MAMYRRNLFEISVNDEKERGLASGASPPSLLKNSCLRDDISFRVPPKQAKIKLNKPKKPPRGVYDPSQPPDFALHAESLDAERGDLLQTVQTGSHEARAININYNRLIKALTELANDFSLSPHWKKYELEMEYALDSTLDRTILNLNEGGYKSKDISALHALKQEVHARVSHLVKQQEKTYEEKTTSHLNKIMQRKTQDQERGH